MNRATALATAANPAPRAEATPLADVDDLTANLQKLACEILAQCRDGWDINTLARIEQSIRRSLARLEDADQPAVTETVLALRTALAPVVKRQRVPDHGTNALVAALSQELRQRLGAPARAPAPVAPTDARGARILLVGLGRDQARYLVASLEEHGGAKATHIAEPLAVLEALASFRPQLIALNHAMPVCDCEDLIGMIRAQHGGTDVPIIELYAGEHAPQGDVPAVCTDLQAPQWVAAIAAHLPAAAEAAEPRQSRSTCGHDRRRWLLDRLESALTDPGGQHGGLLEIGIDTRNDAELEAMHRELGAIQAQIRALVKSVLDNGDILADDDTGFLLLSRGRGPAHLEALGDELLTRLRQERFGANALPLTVSVGGCVIDGRLDQVQAVLDAAHRARRAAGPDAMGWFRYGVRALDEGMLKAALQSGRVYLVYQALASLNGEAWPRYQALARMRDDEGVVRAAGEMLPLARRAGLLPALDRHSLETSLALLATWQERARRLQLFVSQSGEALAAGGFPGQLADALGRHRAHGKRLVLDFRCGDIARAPEHLLRMATRIRSLDVGLCLSGVDDSAAAASLIDALPLDFIKLVPRLNDQAARAVAHAHARRIRVIATHVDNDEQLRQLRRDGVDLVQGHHLAHPSRAVNYHFEKVG